MPKAESWNNLAQKEAGGSNVTLLGPESNGTMNPTWTSSVEERDDHNHENLREGERHIRALQLLQGEPGKGKVVYLWLQSPLGHPI